MARYLGILAVALGRLDAAVEHFEEALAANRRAGALALVADTLVAYGSALVDTGEHTCGDELLGEALVAYRELGMSIAADRIAQRLDSKPADPATSLGNVFRRDGELWTLTYAGLTVRLRHAKGLCDIASLLARPGREVHVVDLITATEGTRPVATAGTDRTDSRLRPGTRAPDPTLDERARAAYRDRLIELRDELEEAEAFADTARAARAREEMDLLARESPRPSDWAVAPEPPGAQPSGPARRSPNASATCSAGSAPPIPTSPGT